MSQTPYDKFRASDALRKDLANVLSNSTLDMALSAIRDMARPKRLPDPLPGSHPDTNVAHEYYRLLGINLALDLLQSLTEPPVAAPKADSIEDAPYFHTLPEPMKAAIRKINETNANQ